MRIFRNGQKKGSLQLSINAIVILVMAMVVLGLGIGFIQRMFTSGGEGLFEVMENNQLEKQATPSEPFTVSNTVNARIAKTGKLQVGYFNDDSVNMDIRLMDGNTKVLCTFQNGDEVNFTFSPGEVTVPAGDAVGLRVAVFVPKEKDDGNLTDPGTYTCPIYLQGKDTTAADTEYDVVASSTFFVEASR